MNLQFQNVSFKFPTMIFSTFGLSLSISPNHCGERLVRIKFCFCMQDGDEALDATEHRHYRRSVGRLQWLCPLRPDICYAVKELARSLSAPTREDQARVKHLLRYLKGTLHYVFVLAVKVVMIGANLEIICHCDSDWAGDLKTRKSTSGFLISLSK